MLEKTIDLSKTKKIACIGHSSYNWTNIHYNKESNEFIAAEYHCSSIDDAEEFCDNISIITLEEALTLVYHDALKMRDIKECVGFVEPEIIKSVINQKERKQNNSKNIEIMVSGLTADNNAEYYECKNGSIFKYSFSTREYYKYENGYWNSQKDYLVQLLNEDEIKYYSHRKWKEHCGEALPVEVTVNMLTEELLGSYGENKKAFFGLGLTFLIFSGIFLTLGLISVWATYIAYIILPIAIILLVLYFISLKRINNIKNHNFYLVYDTCVAKNNYLKSTDFDTDTKYYEKYFRFKGYGEFKLNNSLYIMYNKGGIKDLYLETQTGDKFYLVYVGKEKKAKLIFSEKHYELSRFEFVRKENKIIPFIPYK